MLSQFHHFMLGLTTSTIPTNVFVPTTAAENTSPPAASIPAMRRGRTFLPSGWPAAGFAIGQIVQFLDIDGLAPRTHSAEI